MSTNMPPQLAPARLPRRTPLFIRAQVALFRATRGAIGGRVGDMRFLLLTTTGRRSGQRFTVMLSYERDGNTPYVIASNYGNEHHPAWYLNLVDNPQVEVEIEGKRREATAEVANAQERARIWPTLIAHAPRYANYQHKTTREIPVVLLHLTPDR